MKGVFIVFLSILPIAVTAQEKFGYEAIRRGDFVQRTVGGVRTMADGEHFSTLSDGEIGRYRYSDGEKVDVIYRSQTPFSDYCFSNDENLILLTTNSRPIYRRSFYADYKIYDRSKESLEPLTPQGGERDAAFSPDGSMVAFIRDDNIFYRELGSNEIVAVTADGRRNSIINGHTDWVYEEEFAFTRAFEFSPDSRRIAFLRFDESQVPEFTIMRYISSVGENAPADRAFMLYPEPYTFKYPKAGEKNSVVELYVYDTGSRRSIKVDTGAEEDQYISRIGWTPAGELYFYRVNRLQNHFELMLADPATGLSREIYTESDPRYIERPGDRTVTFLPDGGRFILQSERDGVNSLYLCETDKGVVHRITDGQVTDLVAISGDTIYYIGCETSPLRRNLYRISVNGGGKTMMTDDKGTYSVSPSTDMKYYLSYFTNARTPVRVTLHRSNGTLIRVLEDNAALKAKITGMPVREFFDFVTERGDTLNGYMLRPVNFDAAKRYPLLMTQYSGPGSQQVADRWNIDWEDVLVQEGYIVACVDPRGTGFRGADFKKSTYGDLGGKETQDQISAAGYLGSLPYIDQSRIGIYGWSYGGFTSLNAILKGNDIFKMAIAIAPVVSWRLYDSIYTEIYNGLPQDNAKGYDDNSPIFFADRLKGNLFLAHGAGDDNVHVQNTLAMINALVRAGRNFDLMIYPDDNHSMRPAGRIDISERMIAYTLENL